MTVELQSRAVSARDDDRHGRSTGAPRGDQSRDRDRVGDRRVVQALAGHGVTDLDRITFLGGLGEGTRLPRRGCPFRYRLAVPWDPIGNDMEVRGVDVRVDLAGGNG